MNPVRYNLAKAYALTASRLFSNGCQAYWWDQRTNFGDLLTPALLRRFGRTPIHKFPALHDCNDWVMVGSLLQMLPTEYSGNILGTGIIDAVRLRLPNAKFWSVRGELTKETLGLPASIPTGDPGLLSDRLLTKPPKKDHLLGLIPHYVDKASEWIHQFMSNHPKQVLLIDVERPAKQVIEDIGRCRMIASSSLHGIIVADAFHIPNVWLEISTDVAGGGFKFYDYNSSIRADQKAIRCRDLKDIASIGRLAVLKDFNSIENKKLEIAMLLQQTFHRQK